MTCRRMANVMSGVLDAAEFEFTGPICPELRCIDDAGHAGAHRESSGLRWWTGWRR